MPADKCIGADAIQFNMDVLVDAHQIQFSVLHFNVDFAGKICTCELPEVFLRDRYLVRLHRMLRFFPIQDIGDAFPKPVLVQRFIVGQNDDAEIILKEILRIRGNPVGVSSVGIHRYAVSVIPVQSVTVVIHVLCKKPFIRLCGQQLSLFQALIPLLQIVTVRDQCPGSRQEQVVDIRHTNRLPVIMHIIGCLVFVNSQAVVKHGAGHSQRKEYVFMQESCVGLF